MSTENENGPPRDGDIPKPNGKRYDSVEEMVKELGKDSRAKFAEYRNQTRIVQQLAELRQMAGLTQEEMARHLDVTQSAISKLESGPDENLTLREIREYSRATGQRIGVFFGKPLNHVEAVKVHALSIKERLEALAKIANHDQELEKEIQGFFGEAFFNILTILASCNDKLPSGSDFEVKVEICNKASAKPIRAPSEPVLV